MLGAGALGRLRGIVWGGRREESSEWGTHVYLWQIHFDVWQNQYNIVKLKDGGGVGWGEHFLPHKFIKRTFKRRVNSTKQLLNCLLYTSDAADDMAGV